MGAFLLAGRPPPDVTPYYTRTYDDLLLQISCQIKIKKIKDLGLTMPINMV